MCCLITAITLSSCILIEIYPNDNETSDIFGSVYDNDIQRARLLYQQGQSPYTQSKGSLLHALHTKSTPEIIQFVFDLSLDLEYENSDGATAIFYSSGSTLKRMLQEGADVHHHDKSGRTAIYFITDCAIWSSSKYELEQRMNDIDTLLQYGADINETVGNVSILDNLLTYQFNTTSHLTLLHPFDLTLSNREVLYKFLRAKGAKISAELR